MHAENCFRRQLGRISSYFEWKVLARLQNGYMLAKKRKGVKVEVVSSPRGNKLAQSDIDKFNAQYGGIMFKTSLTFHDRFLIIDGKELYLIGASLKDLGKRCFAFSSLDKSNIPDILAKI